MQGRSRTEDVKEEQQTQIIAYQWHQEKSKQTMTESTHVTNRTKAKQPGPIPHPKPIYEYR